jgi:hypothetical protein
MVCPGSCVRDRAAAYPGVCAPLQMPLTAGVAVTGDADAQSVPVVRGVISTTIKEISMSSGRGVGEH